MTVVRVVAVSLVLARWGGGRQLWAGDLPSGAALPAAVVQGLPRWARVRVHSPVQTPVKQQHLLE